MRHLLLAALLAAAVAAQVPTPEAFLGTKPGSSGYLAGYDEICAYMQKLAETSDRVLYRVIGRSTRGLPFAQVVISSPANLRRLEEIRLDNLRLADPRGPHAVKAEAIVRRGKAIVVVNESIHSTEVGPSQAGMVTAHFLASTDDPAWRKVLDDVVVLLTPCHNPDGYEIVVDWWNEHKDDPKRRGAPLPVLYHEYVGHDNNRDWFMFTQDETRVTIEQIYMKWRPQIVVDQHQMGGRGARMFVPPYQEPYEPNVHPLLRERLEEVGRFVMARLVASGRTGVWCNTQFDAWTPARAFQHYHGAVRFLTEVASCRWADPVTVRPRMMSRRARTASKDNPEPWKPGPWTLADVVDYTSQGALLVVRHASQNRRKWLRSFHRVHADQVEARTGPAGFLIARREGDGAVIDKFLDVMTLGGVEVGVTQEPRTIDGGAFPAGSLVIGNGQPCFSFARALLENTPYPEIRTSPGGPLRRPYDVTSHSLPLLMGLQAAAVPRGEELPAHVDPATCRRTGLLPEETRQVRFTEGTPVKAPLLLPARDPRSHVEVQRAAAAGHAVKRTPGHDAFLVVPGEDGFPCRLPAGAARPAPAGFEGGTAVRPTRVGLYTSWLASMDEGWTRFTLDLFGIPWTALDNGRFQAGDLARDADVIVFADYGRSAVQRVVAGRRSPRLPERYRGGIGEKGVEALVRFVRGGGTLVTLNGSSRLPIEVFDLPLREVDTGSRVRPGRDGRPRFNVPGSMLVTEVDPESDLALGLPHRLPVFFRRGRAFETAGQAREDIAVTFPLVWAREDVVAGGWAEGTQLLSGHAAVADVRVGKGRVVMFGFSPQFRCQTWGTFPLFFNALLGGSGDGRSN